MATEPKKRAPAHRHEVRNLGTLAEASLLTIPQFCALEPAFTEGGVRWTVFNEGKELEQSGAIVRLGRRILIHRRNFIGRLLPQQRAA